MLAQIAGSKEKNGRFRKKILKNRVRKVEMDKIYNGEKIRSIKVH